MIEPQGPLPSEIYWRRRIVAGGVAVAALALVIGANSSLSVALPDVAADLGASQTELFAYPLGLSQPTRFLRQLLRLLMKFLDWLGWFWI